MSIVVSADTCDAPDSFGAYLYSADHCSAAEIERLRSILEEIQCGLGGGI